MRRLLPVVALALLGHASALFFYVTEGQEKCFLEAVPEDTSLAIKYENKDYVPWGHPDWKGVVRCQGGLAAVSLHAQLWIRGSW